MVFSPGRISEKPNSIGVSMFARLGKSGQCKPLQLGLDPDQGAEPNDRVGICDRDIHRRD
jgi:hypothetical protein